MIKSSTQLKNAEERLLSIRKSLAEFNEKYSGIDFELYAAPLIVEERKLLEEIIEYKKLKELSFVDAVNYLHYQPALIDNIGELLSKLRIAAKLSQAEMAKQLGWEQSNLSRFESENYSSQTVNKIVEYASSLGVWLHIVPSLGEELEILLEKKPDVKTHNVTSSDVVTTSLSVSNEATSDATTTSKYTGSEKYEIVSI